MIPVEVHDPNLVEHSSVLCAICYLSTYYECLPEVNFNSSEEQCKTIGGGGGGIG